MTTRMAMIDAWPAPVVPDTRVRGLRRCFRAWLMLASMAGAFPALAAESYDNCSGFIDSLPATISTQGVWCVRGHLTTAIASGAAITVATNNVTVDCNGFKLGGLAAGDATGATGILAAGRHNVVVRHCQVRGFSTGASLQGSGNVVEDSHFEGNTYAAIVVGGDGSAVRRNMVLDTGHSTLNASAFGIALSGGADAIDNSVHGVAARAGGNGDAVGIWTYLGTGGSISRNRVWSVAADGSGITTGIFNAQPDRMVVTANHVAGGGTGVGLECAVGTGRARDNVIHGFTSNIVGCGDAGGNDVSP